MLKIRIIPTILYDEFKMVKGINFNSWRTVGNIIQAIRIYKIREVDELILMDISATNKKKKINLELIKDISEDSFMPLTFGGGINNIEQISQIIKNGADKVSINTAATKNLDLIYKASNNFGSQCIVVSIDYKVENNEIVIYSNSGEQRTKLNIIDYIKSVEEAGAGEILLTSIDKEGTMTGYDLKTIKYVSDNSKLPIIASGGCGKPQDMVDLAKKVKVSGIAAASMYHFTHHTPNDTKKNLEDNGFPVRT